MKGIACVFILLGHYGQRKAALMPDAGFISKAVWMSTANIGLVWFMFFSGYGLSLKHMEKGEIMGKWWNRLKKVYLPLLFTSLISIGAYALLPMKFDAAMSKKLWLVDEIAAIHQGNFMGWFPSAFGWLDWYVFCIMIFYTLFYLSYFIMKKTGWNQTLVLSFLMVAYFVWAYKVFGTPAAHWYRFIWTFLLGHIIANNAFLEASSTGCPVVIATDKPDYSYIKKDLIDVLPMNVTVVATYLNKNIFKTLDRDSVVKPYSWKTIGNITKNKIILSS